MKSCDFRNNFKMVVKCVFNDCGFCKFGQQCRYQHSEQVCKVRTCLNQRCPRRHPKRCRSFFLRKYCKFGSKCKFDHTYECENCDNLKYLIDKEVDKVSERVVEKD